MGDPLSIIVISATAGGVAGKLVEKAWEVGEKWLSNYYRDHYPQAQQKAQQNALDFLADLAGRVRKLEGQAAEGKQLQEAIANSLNDPDFSATLKDAILTSSRTDNKEKHRLLGRLVSERLMAKQDSAVALAATLACDAIAHLGSRHLHTLGLAAVVYEIRPVLADQLPELGDQLDSGMRQWWEARCGPLVKDVGLSRLDIYHLMAVSCVEYSDIVTRGNLVNLMSARRGGSTLWSAKDFVDNHPVGQKLTELWKQGMQSIFLTSVGQLIGIYVADEVAGSTTKIDW